MIVNAMIGNNTLDSEIEFTSIDIDEYIGDWR